jgi:hypothetical protein
MIKIRRVGKQYRVYHYGNEVYRTKDILCAYAYADTYKP